MKTHDALGRRFVNQSVSTGRKLHPLSPAKAEILEVIDWLGVASSENIKELLRLNGLKDWRGNGRIITNMVNETETEDGDTYLMRPDWQFPDPLLARPNGHLHVVHDLGIGGVNYLKRHHKYRGIVHGGHREHQLMEATILWELYLGVKRNRDFTFIPHHRAVPLLSDMPNEYEVPLIVDGQTFDTVLRPDAHFAIDYGGKQRHFFLEADRGSEQKDKVLYGKKTIERSLRQYRSFLGGRDGVKPLFQRLLETDAPGTALFIFNKKSKCEAAMDLLNRITGGKGNNYIGFKVDERFEPDEFAPPKFSLQNWKGEYMRVGRAPFRIDGKTASREAA